MNKLSQEELALVIETATQLNSITPEAVEKDIFVTKAIHAIADMNHPVINLVFCGGTCLAKAHQIVSRMSEDVDFKIFPAISFVSLSEQRKKLSQFRQELTESLKNSGFEISEKNLRARDNNGYIIYQLHYPSHFEQHDELRPYIQLEFTLALPRLPTTIKPIFSLVDHVFPEDNLTEKHIACISILETAAEKWVGLTRRIASIARGHDPIDETLVRHLYDIQAITQHVDLTTDFFGLVNNTIDCDRAKFKRHHEYSADTAEEIKYSLKILGSDPVWMKSYHNFVEAMIFNNDENSGFDQCYKKLQEITEQVLSQLEQQP